MAFSQTPKSNLMITLAKLPYTLRFFPSPSTTAPQLYPPNHICGTPLHEFSQAQVMRAVGFWGLWGMGRRGEVRKMEFFLHNRNNNHNFLIPPRLIIIIKQQKKKRPEPSFTKHPRLRPWNASWSVVGTFTRNVDTRLNWDWEGAHVLC